jgi:arsenate reductase
MKVTIYHNPRCSKSRMTLELLRSRSIEPEVVEYLKTPLSESELFSLLEMLKLSPRDLLRKGEAAYKEAGLDQDGVSDQQIIQAMVQYPVLIERPIVVANGKAAIGRPPENILDIL